MPRRNQRAVKYEPLDLTPADMPKATSPSKDLTAVDFRRRTADERRERAERQHNARINGGIDWSACLVPGCGGTPYLPQPENDHKTWLPLCVDHTIVAYNHGNIDQDNPVITAAHDRHIERRRAAADETKKQKLANTNGHIYVVRLNGLIKVGWSRDVHERLRSYGPDVEIIAAYQGTRDDETLLHRQLRPALAKGREWYEDGKILQDFIADTITRYGHHDIEPFWTSPKKIVGARRRR